MNYREKKTNEALLQLLHAKDHLQNLIDQRVESNERHVIESLKDNSSRFWSYVKSKLSNRQNFLEKIKSNDVIIDDPLMMAESLNEQFYKCFNKRSRNLNTINLESGSYLQGIGIQEVQFDFRIIRDIIRKIPNKRSHDYDGISYAVLKGGGDILALQLDCFFKLTFKCESIPNDRRKSIIIPLRKKTTSIDIEDFRPINITSCVYRILERSVRNTIYRYLTDNSIIKSSQHGFLKGRSTTTALLSYANEIHKSLDKNMCVDTAYFDFSKAFDSVRHDFLIEKLMNIGIHGSLLKWIIDYFSNRTQIVNVNGFKSSERKVCSGVVQGSVLGPLLFTIFVNDIDQDIKNSAILKYADDIRLYRFFKTDQPSQLQNAMLFQDDINAMIAWSLKWDLKFNISKCCVQHFGSKNVKSDYKIDDKSLQKKILEKDLGVLFPINLKFNEHIDTIVKKANRQLGIIGRVFKTRNMDTIIPLYKTFVRPILEYNSVIWSPYMEKYDHQIERIQMRMFKLMNNVRSLSYKEKLKKANLLTLRARRIKHQLMIAFKIKNNDMDLCFDDFFEENHFKKTRGNVLKLSLQKSRTKKYQNFFTCAIVKHWNKLKSSEIKVRTSNAFKASIRKYFVRAKIW